MYVHDALKSHILQVTVQRTLCGIICSKPILLACSKSPHMNAPALQTCMSKRFAPAIGGKSTLPLTELWAGSRPIIWIGCASLFRRVIRPGQRHVLITSNCHQRRSHLPDPDLLQAGQITGVCACICRSKV